MTRPGGMNGIRLTCLATAALTVLAAGARARDVTAGYMLNMYSDVQGVNVYTHYVDVGTEAWRGVDFSLHYVHDRVIIPAIDAPPGTPEAIDAITTASRPITSEADAYTDYVKERNALQATVGYKGAAIGYYVSNETDYFAQMATLAFNRDFLHDNLNFAAGVSYSWDVIRPLDHLTVSNEPADHRQTLHGNFVATGVLTPTTVLRGGVEVNNVDGQQEDPYRNVWAGGLPSPENHPRERLRRSSFVRLSQYFANRSAVKIDARFYDDDWDVASRAYGVRLNQYVSDAVVVRYRYRYYSQDAAFFYRDLYTEQGGVDGYLTGDYRLQDFNSHLFGGQLVWRPQQAPLFPGTVLFPELILSYERYFNSNNFTANIFEMGLQVSF